MIFIYYIPRQNLHSDDQHYGGGSKSLRGSILLMLLYFNIDIHCKIFLFLWRCAGIFFGEPHGVFYILFCDSIYFLHSYYCCVIVEFLLPFSCLNEISVPTSLSICVLRA